MSKFTPLYSGLDNLHEHLNDEQKGQLDGLLEMSGDPAEAKARMVNQAYVRTMVPQLDEDTAANNWPAVKKSFAKQVLGVDKPEVSDTELYTGIAGHLKQQQDERAMMGDVVKKMTETAFQDDEPANWLTTYSGMVKGLEGNPGFIPANRDRYRQVAQQAFTEAQTLKASLKPAADTVLSVLRGDRDAADLKDFYAKDREATTGTPMDALDAIKAIPAEQRPLLYSMIAQKGAAEGQQQGAAKNFGENLTKSLGNVLSDLYRDNRAVFDNGAIVHAQAMAKAADKVQVTGQPEPGESMLDFVNRSNPGARGIVDFLGDVVRAGGSAPTRSLNAQEQAQLKQETADLKDTADIARQLKDLSRGVVDPVVGMNALTRKVLYPALAMAGPVAEAMTPYVGLPLLINTTVGQSIEAFSRQGMAPEQAQKLGLVAGAVQAPLVMVSSKMVAGSLPFLKNIISEPVQQTLDGISARGATLFAVEAGTQNVLAAAQELTPPTVQWLASKMSADYPGVDWSAELKGFSGRRIDTFWAMLPMVAIGTGVATFSDAAYGRQYLGNLKLLRAAGFDEVAAKKIIEAPDLEARQQIVRELWHEFDHENREAQQAHFDDLDAEMRTSYQEHAPEDGPSTVRLDDGSYEVRDHEGNPIDVTTTPEAALDLMQQHQQAQSTTLGEAVNDMVDYVRGIHEQGQTTEVTGLKKSLGDRIKEGSITPAEAKHAIEVAVGLGHLEAGTKPGDVAIAGENFGEHNARLGYYEDVSLIHEGADPLTVIEEHAEGYLKRRLAAGELDLDAVNRWRDGVDGPGGDRTARGLTEWFSHMAKAYITGNADNVGVPASFRTFLNKLRDYFSNVLETAARLMTLERDGKLPDGFQKHLARATGLDEAWLMARARGEEKAAAVGKPLELGEWIRGKLPHPKAAAAKGEALAGELRALYDGMQKTVNVAGKMERQGEKGRKAYTRKDNSAAVAFFAKEADYGALDSIAEMAREAGFNDILTPADLLDAVDKSLRGVPTYAHPIERGQVEADTFGLKKRGAGAGIDKSGDLFAQGDQHEELTLAGEQGTDFAGHMDKKAADAEAKRQAEAAQGEMTFSLKEAKNLLAVHNTNEERLKKILKLGGLAVPSIAVVRTDKGAFANFGDITLVGSPELIDPKRSKANRVFNADVYSPRFPTTKTFLTKTDERALKDRFYSAKSELHPDVVHKWAFDTASLTDAVKDEGMDRAIQQSPLVKLAWAKETGNPVIKEIGNQPDYYKVKDKLEKAARADEDGFNRWAKAEVSKLGLNPEEKIRLDNDRNGNARYKTLTLDSAVRELNKAVRDAEGFTYGVGNLRAKVAKQFRSIEGMQAARDSIVSKPEMKALKEKTDAEFMELANEASEQVKAGGKDFGFLDAFVEHIREAIDTGRWDATFKEYYNEGYDWKPVAKFVDSLRSMPTEYFEAKIGRAVQVPEFSAAIIPHDTSAEMKATLQRKGLRLVEYQRGDLEDRARAMQAVPDLTFALAHREALDEIQRIFAPQSRGADAAVASGVFREHGAELAQRTARAGEYLKAAHEHLAAMPEPARWDFVDAVEHGAGKATPELEAIADRFRRILDHKRGEVQALGTGELDHFIENYFPHIWANPEQAAQILRKARLEGSGAFLKAREIPTIKEGMALGLIPKSSNPVDLVLLKAHEMDKFILAQRAMKELTDKGLALPINKGADAPEGWQPINEKVSHFTLTPRSAENANTPVLEGYPADEIQGKRTKGQYWAPEEVAQLINNHLSPGLRGSKSFEAYLTAANTLNQFQLGLSAFHLGFTSLDAATSKLALGIEQLVGGDLADAAKSIALTPVAAFTNAVQGDKVLKEWFKPGSQGGDLAQIVDSLKAAGGRAQMDAFYQTTMTKKLLEAFRRGGSGYLEAGLRALPAGIELAAKPIMEYIVPRQKLGIFADLARRELAGLPKTATRDDVRAVMAKAWDSVDNRMGQMVYDNLFWNKAAKDLSMASVRSLGWNLGTLRELGGGALDTVKAGKGIVTGDPKSAEFTHRMAYVVAMPLLTGLLGAMTQYLLTGKGPDEAKDYFFPKTGERDPQGREIRLTLPSYMKDVAHYAHEPVNTLTGKVHPAIALVADMLNNKDYFGRPIRNEDDPIMQQALAGAKHVAEQFEPMGISNFIKSHRAQTGRGEQVANFFGITKAPQWLSMSPAEQLAQKLVSGKMGPETAQPSQEKMDAKQRALGALRNGTQEQRQQAAADIDKLVASGQLTRTEARNLMRSSAKVYLVDRMQHLDAREAMRVFRVATPDERAVLRDVVGAKIVRAQLPPADKIELMQSLESLSKK